MMSLFLKLLMAHLIGDFFLQSSKAVVSKELLKIRSPYLYIHCLLHILLAGLLVWDLHFWPYALFLGFSHYLIDLAKLYWQVPEKKTLFFVVDQLLHISLLWLIVISYLHMPLHLGNLLDDQHLLFYSCVLFLTHPCSIFIKTAISQWTPLQRHETELNGSLQYAGKWIGYMERLLVFAFIVFGQFGAIGFLLAAKSIFRFGDLKQGENRRLTEYVLIGTLLSFGIAILTGMVYQKIFSSLS